MIQYADQVASGDLQGTSALLYGYGLYLLGGGTPSDFKELSDEDIQIMIQTKESLAIRERIALLKGLVEIFTGREVL